MKSLRAKSNDGINVGDIEWSEFINVAVYR